MELVGAQGTLEQDPNGAGAPYVGALEAALRLVRVYICIDLEIYIYTLHLDI